MRKLKGNYKVTEFWADRHITFELEKGDMLGIIGTNGAGKSSVTALQRLGRIMRPFGDKSSCKFITYNDNVRYLREHTEKKIQIWSTEPEFMIRRNY